MIRTEFERFSAIVPEGWAALLDDATYSDAGGDQVPTRFVGSRGTGELIVSTPALHPDEQPGADADELESLAREWGLRRGVTEPLGVSTESGRGLASASAIYRIGDELVEVWFVSDGAALLRATYVCPWSDRDQDRAARHALIGSLRFR